MSHPLLMLSSLLLANAILLGIHLSCEGSDRIFPMAAIVLLFAAGLH